MTNPSTPFKYEIGQTVYRFGSRVKIIGRREGAMGKLPTYEIEEYYMGNRVVTSAWQDELNVRTKSTLTTTPKVGH